jgi:anti-sigma factor RsiW
MNCQQAQALFGPYWDDELTQAEREWLEAHFGSCAPCRRDYEELARSLEWMTELPRTEVSPGFAERVLAQARRRTPATDRVPGSAPRWIPVTAAAALLAVLGGMVLQWTGGPLAIHRPAGAPLGQPVALQPERVVHGTPAVPVSDLVAGAGEIPDSLFDHSEDVEFILDPVTLRKGRAHTVVRGPTETPRTEQAVITF